MNRIIISRKAVEISVVFGLLCAIFMSISHFNAACDDLRTNVLRLHIIANSDSDEDQALKLKIRDRILQTSSDVFDGNMSLEEAIAAAQNSLADFKETADSVISENGYDYSTQVSVADNYFNTREYDDFTLPAGTYKSLIVRVGAAKGKNWWCVIFPAVCVPAAGKCDLSDSTTKESAEIAENPQRYVMKFKTVEIYEDIKNFFKQ